VKKNPFVERYANIAACAVSEQIEWVFLYYERTDESRLDGAKTLTDFRRMIFERCPELKLMWDVGDASKHRFLTRAANPARTIESSTAAYFPGAAGLLLAGAEFRKTLTAAVEFWRTWAD
jgi:hypothetical protein